jgi:hypothetical protein
MPPKRMGRPPTGGPLKRPINVMLDLRVAEGLRTSGHGNMSVGVALAAEKAGKMIAAKAAAALPDVRPVLSAPVMAWRKAPGGGWGSLLSE